MADASNDDSHIIDSGETLCDDYEESDDEDDDSIGIFIPVGPKHSYPELEGIVSIDNPMGILWMIVQVVAGSINVGGVNVVLVHVSSDGDFIILYHACTRFLNMKGYL